MRRSCRDLALQCIDQHLDVGGIVATPDTDPDGATGHVRGHAHRTQHVARFAGAGVTRRAAGDRHPFAVESEQQGLTVDAVDGERQGVGQAWRIRREQGDAVHGEKLITQLCCQRLRAVVARLELLGGQRRRGAETDDASEVLRTATQATFLATTALQWHEIDGRVDDQCTNALRPVDLVRREAHEIETTGAEFDRQLAERLDGVAVHPGACGTCLARHLGHRLDHAGLVVGPHRRNDARVLAGLPGIDIDLPVVVDRQPVDTPAQPLQRACRLDHRRVLDGTQREAPGPLQRSQAAQREVVGLGAAAGEDDLSWLHSDQCGDLLARLLQRHAGTAAGLVGTRRVARPGIEARQHGVADPGVERSRGVVIEVGHPGPARAEVRKRRWGARPTTPGPCRHGCARRVGRG
jgi:hypothetical protein